MDKRRGITFFRRDFFCFTVPEKHRGGTLLCFNKFLVWNRIGVKKSGYHIFLSDFFCLTVPKTIVGEDFRISEKFWYGKELWIRGGVSLSSVGNFLSQSTERFRRGNTCTSEMFCCRAIFRIMGVSCLSVEKFQSHSAKKFRGGTLQCFRKSLVWKKLMDKMGGIRFFRRKLNCFVSPCRKTSWETLLCFRNILVKKSEKSGVSWFSGKKILSHSAKKFRQRYLVLQKCSGIENLWIVIVSRFSRFFCLMVRKKVKKRRLRFRNVLELKNFPDNRLTRSCQNLLSHSSKNFHWGTFLCFFG